ncbi:hypothetical protein ISS30_11535, partial [bacterium]|nr:hypothetical protein [bacterium]
SPSGKGGRKGRPYKQPGFSETGDYSVPAVFQASAGGVKRQAYPRQVTDCALETCRERLCSGRPQGSPLQPDDYL